MNETLFLRTEALKTRYLETVNKFNSSTEIDSLSLSIPATLAPYQFQFNDLFRHSQVVSDRMEEMYHMKLLSYKTGMSELSVIDVSSTELKRMIESSKDYRELKQEYDRCVADMKIVEDMISTIKNFSFNVNNSLKFKELVGGAS